MEKFDLFLEKFFGNKFGYFLAALFFVSPLLFMFPHPATYVMVFGFLVAWIHWVDLKKKEQ